MRIAYVLASSWSCGPSDFCRHNENSLVTGVGNIPLMVWHILHFLAHPQLRCRLQANAIATARSLPWSRVADNLEHAFRRGLEEPS